MWKQQLEKQIVSESQKDLEKKERIEGQHAKGVWQYYQYLNKQRNEIIGIGKNNISLNNQVSKSQEKQISN